MCSYWKLQDGEASFLRKYILPCFISCLSTSSVELMSGPPLSGVFAPSCASYLRFVSLMAQCSVLLIQGMRCSGLRSCVPGIWSCCSNLSVVNPMGHAWLQPSSAFIPWYFSCFSYYFLWDGHCSWLVQHHSSYPSSTESSHWTIALMLFLLLSVALDSTMPAMQSMAVPPGACCICLHPATVC